MFRNVALAAGLDCTLISGHGKGYGYVSAGIVPFNSNHAWNAVKLESGWKLIDSCWGAGSCNGGAYTPKLNGLHFTMPNEQFGHRHYPGNGEFHVASPPSWETYITSWNADDMPMVYSDAADQGIDITTLEPSTRQVSGAIRVLVSKVCPHWNARPSRLLMVLAEVHGKSETLIPQSDGFWWWWDLSVESGQVMLVALETLGGRDALGVSAQEFLAVKGRQGYSFVSLASWDVA